MIPNFPDFKKLELSDYKDIREITSKFPPYSDFDFLVMWSWDLNGTIQISNLNGNLVLLARNIYDNSIVCSFLGDFNVNDTINKIYDYLDDLKAGDSKISLVPEHCLNGLDFKKYFIEIDLNSCDYLYDLSELVNLQGNQYEQKRGRVNLFTRSYSDIRFETIDLSKNENVYEILSLNNSWAINRNKYSNKKEEKNMEPESLKRFIEANFSDLHSFGLYINNQLIGYSIFSASDNLHVINHYIKADITYKGVYEYLLRESSKYLLDSGFRYMNYQEDMGIQGLRQAKMAYRPMKFLKKYFIGRL